MEEVPTGNAWQTRSYLLSDLASKRAAVRMRSRLRCAASRRRTEPCRPQLVDCGGNASGAFAAAARQGVTIVALLQTHAVRCGCHKETPRVASLAYVRCSFAAQHVDHVLGLSDARAAAPDAPLHLHAGDAALYGAYGVPLPKAMLPAAARAFPLAARLAAAAGVGDVRLPVVDVWLQDGCALPLCACACSMDGWMLTANADAGTSCRWGLRGCACGTCQAIRQGMLRFTSQSCESCLAAT